MVVTMKRILETGRNVWCEKAVTAAGLLVDGDDYFKAFYDAALGAQRNILLSGWQFDSDVALLRGPDAERAELPVTLKKFLNALTSWVARWGRRSKSSSPAAGRWQAESPSRRNGNAYHELVELYASAIAAAERSIYIETQYFSSSTCAPRP